MARFIHFVHIDAMALGSCVFVGMFTPLTRREFLGGSITAEFSINFPYAGAPHV